MSLIAITCESCGGSVAMPAGKRHPSCLFCGSETLILKEPPEDAPVPSTYVPFVLDEVAARSVFKEWAKERFWAPAAIRAARVDLNDLLLPAWTWNGRVETHWAALVSAGGTRSGKRPRSGDDTMYVDGMLVLASQTLRRAELAAISPFDSGSELPFVPESATLPYELGSLTRRAATGQARTEMRGQHAAQIGQQTGALRLSTSCLFADMEGRPMLLPVWIGAYRVGEKMYRVVLNGQTGELTGTAPISWGKVLLAAGAALASLVVVATVFAALASS
jgi:hypothetical protein